MPIQGQSSQQLRGSGVSEDAKEGNGLVDVSANANNPVRQRGLDNDVAKGTRGKSGEGREDILGVEDSEPLGTETVADERECVRLLRTSGEDERKCVTSKNTVYFRHGYIISSIHSLTFSATFSLCSIQ